MLYNELADFKNEVVIMINCFTDFLLVVFNIIAVIGFTSSPFTIELFVFITQSSNLLVKECRIFVRTLQILRWCPLLCMGLEIYFIGGAVGWNIFQCFFPKSIWTFSLNLMVCGLVCLIAKIRCYFAAINHAIEDIEKKHLAFQNEDSTVYVLRESHPKNEETDNYVQCLNHISNQYTQMCNFIDRFNCYIRLFLVMGILSITVNILCSCSILIEFGTKTKTLFDITTQRVLLAVQLISIIINVGQIGLCALIGEDLQNEGQKTSSICYSILNKLNRNSKNEKNNLFMKELNFLVQQSQSRKVCVHAGGFFQLNWGILGSVTSTVATYSIVIIQFLIKRD
ncbi:unnamed protein product [Ceutorhynchus assimilis]|uniref:Gustatory receptor n=1 Tax=Ceutorhynchus assimilis TaxID=467358 RepID=A0A9N9QFE5_9CUCU|nr:unnamed protein product [Ceutorhynchus assimilis]